MAVRNLPAFRVVVEFKNVENLKLCRRDCGSIGAPLQHYSCLGSASSHVNRTANNSAAAWAVPKRRSSFQALLATSWGVTCDLWTHYATAIDSSTTVIATLMHSITGAQSRVLWRKVREGNRISDIYVHNCNKDSEVIQNKIDFMTQSLSISKFKKKL